MARAGSLTPSERFTRADLIGLGVILSIVTVLPWGASSTSAREIAVVAVAFALVPSIIEHRRSIRWWFAAPMLALAGWSVVSMVGAHFTTRAPWLVSVYGWFGRGTGVAVIISVAILFTAALSLTTRLVWRTMDYLIIGATASAMVAIAQMAGSTIARTSSDDGYSGLMGNADFSASLSAMAACVAFASVLRSVQMNGRRITFPLIVRCAATLILGFVALLAGPVQGPIGLVVGALTGLIVISWRWPRAPRWVLPAGIITGGILAAATVVSIAGAGPGARFWQASSMQVRLVYWRTALNMMTGQPLYGSGPDGFARLVGEYRPENYLTFRGSEHHVSAAHSVPLEIGATLGIPALILWFVLIIVVGLIALLTISRARKEVWALAGLTGAWAVYVAQSVISIDMIGLAVVGAVTGGALLAMSRDRRGAQAPAVPSRRIVMTVATVACGVTGVAAVVPSGITTQQALTSISAVQVTSAEQTVGSPWSPCTLRPSIIKRIAAQAPLATAIPYAESAWALDRRCPGVGELVSQYQLSAHSYRASVRSSRLVLTYDPMNVQTWLVLGFGLAAQSDEARSHHHDQRAARFHHQAQHAYAQAMRLGRLALRSTDQTYRHSYEAAVKPLLYALREQLRNR